MFVAVQPISETWFSLLITQMQHRRSVGPVREAMVRLSALFTSPDYGHPSVPHSVAREVQQNHITQWPSAQMSGLAFAPLLQPLQASSQPQQPSQASYAAVAAAAAKPPIPAAGGQRASVQSPPQSTAPLPAVTISTAVKQHVRHALLIDKKESTEFTLAGQLV